MKKIVAQKEEGIAEIIDQVLGAPDDEVTLVVPKGSALGRSVSNFHLLKREADAAGKTVAVESVDDTILAFAKQSELEGSHPLWKGIQGSGGISDILPQGEEDEEEASGGRAGAKKRKKKTESVKLKVRGTDDEKDVKESEEENGQDRDASAEEGSRDEDEEEYSASEDGRESEDRRAHAMKEQEVEEAWNDDEDAPRRHLPSRGWWIAGGVAVLLLAIAAVVTWSFGHATVIIDFRKTPWTYDATFAADKSVAKANTTTNVIPAQVFTSQKNTTQTFPASGNANVSLKAQGTLTIYNAYSSAAQQLVATTRFVTPDGKVFRIISAVTVPGAQVTDGKIVPSSIDAAVAADQPGPLYNVGPVTKLTVPGFQGSPKYAGFYGELKGGASGGFAGKRAVPTATDISSAKAKVTDALKANLSSGITTSYPNNFKILDGATNVAITKLTVSTTTDTNGNFSVFAEATLQAIGFDEAAFKDTLLGVAGTQKPNAVFKTLTLAYSNIKSDFTKGRVSFSLAAQGTLEPAFSESDFKAQIGGKGINEARAAIAALPDLADARISAWPVWLWNIPKDPRKVEIAAD